jgi:hypothetical protein
VGNENILNSSSLERPAKVPFAGTIDFGAVTLDQHDIALPITHKLSEQHHLVCQLGGRTSRPEASDFLACRQTAEQKENPRSQNQIFHGATVTRKADKGYDYATRSDPCAANRNACTSEIPELRWDVPNARRIALSWRFLRRELLDVSKIFLTPRDSAGSGEDG